MDEFQKIKVLNIVILAAAFTALMVVGAFLHPIGYLMAVIWGVGFVISAAKEYLPHPI